MTPDTSAGPIELTVVDREGRTHRLSAPQGQSLMLVLNQAGLGIDGICGGCCVCATCHIYVEQAAAPSLPPLSDDESTLLDGLLARDVNSRLACQLNAERYLAHRRIHIAPAE